MSLKITHKNSTTAGTPPSAGDIDVGEIAMNAADAELYTKDVNGNIKKFANTDTTGTAAGVQFTQAGTGAVERTVESKLQDVVSVKDFGAVGDGVTNDRPALQGALNTGKNVFIPSGTYLFNSSISYSADNQRIYGDGNKSVLKSASGSRYINTNGFDNVSFSDLCLDGSAGTNGGFQITGGSSNTLISNVYFTGGNQRVWIWEADHIKIDGCTFDGTGYGVIQQANYVSSYVSVVNCLAKDMTGDFVEANCTGGAPSFFWTVANNIYSGNVIYPGTGTEDRFVGFTGVQNIVIDGNNVEKCGGDAAVHLEDIGGETIVSNNVFDNCNVSGGNSGYIYTSNNEEHILVTGNIFQRTDTTIGSASALAVNSSTYNNRVIFNNNRVVGTSNNLNGINAGSQSGSMTISSNLFESCSFAVTTFNTADVNFCNNTVLNCTQGIGPQLSSGSNGIRWSIDGNIFYGTSDTYDILMPVNTNGTTASKDIKVSNNKFYKGARISGQGGATAGSSADARDISFTNNYFGAGAVLSTGGTMSRLVKSGNIFVDTGEYKGDFTKVETTVLSVGGAAFQTIDNVRGDITFRVEGLNTLSGSVYEAISLLFILAGVENGGGNTYNRMFQVRLRGLSTYGSASVSDIVGTSTVSVSNTTSTGCDLTFTAPSATVDTNSLVMVVGRANNATVTSV
jgi:hypothetical protein